MALRAEDAGQHATITTRMGTEVAVDRTGIINKLDVSALGLVSPLDGGTGLSALNALHSTVGIGGLGGLQQTTQLNALLRGGTALAGGVSNELAGLCALLGGSQSHDVTLNAMQVLQVQQAMVAQAATKQKEAEAVLQAKIDAEVEKRTKGLVVLPPPSPAKPKTKIAKTADVAPGDDGVSLVSGAPKRAKRRKRHAERAEELASCVTALPCSRKRLRKWLKPRPRRSQVGTHLKMIHARTNHLILNCALL